MFTSSSVDVFEGIITPLFAKEVMMVLHKQIRNHALSQEGHASALPFQKVDQHIVLSVLHIVFAES